MVALACLCDTHFHKTLREAPLTHIDEINGVTAQGNLKKIKIK